MKNLEFSQSILDQLSAQGVTTICLCPGARNAAFVELLSEQSHFETLSFYDERSASFFALGRAKQTNQPVVVLTTSGTAVSETFSAVIEAYYCSIPLVILSCDRPTRLRGTGAPQAIEQAHLFGEYAIASFDLDSFESKNFSLATMGPTQLNICFDEPLLGAPQSREHLQASSFSPPYQNCLLVVGALASKDRENIQKQLSRLNVPIFLESGSGLRGIKELADRVVLGGEKQIAKMLDSGEVKNVARVGDIPVGRYWRNLDQLDINTFSFSDKAFSGLENGALETLDLNQLRFNPKDYPEWNFQSWLKSGQEAQANIEQLVEKYPKSELSFFDRLNKLVERDQKIYIGNSLPIREWGLVNDFDCDQFASRGVNGIDGQISTALGSFQPKTTNWVVLGDLTCLYDFNGFWITNYLKDNDINVNFLVINNHGGQIFSRIFSNRNFRNEHSLSFQKFAEFWSWNYQIVSQPNDLNKFQPGLNFIEVTPDADQTQKFWQEYDQLW